MSSRHLDPPQRDTDNDIIHALQSESRQLSETAQENSPLVSSDHRDSDLARQLQKEEEQRDREYEQGLQLAQQLQREEDEYGRHPFDHTHYNPTRPRDDYQHSFTQEERGIDNGPSPQYVGNKDVDLARRLQKEEERRDREYEQGLKLAQQLQREEDVYGRHPLDHTHYNPTRHRDHYQHPIPRYPGNDSYQPAVNGTNSPPPPYMYTPTKTDEEVARKLQLEEDRFQHTVPTRSHDVYVPHPDISLYAYEEEPRPKPPPIKADEEGGIPCQFCNKLFPFEQITYHQVHVCSKMVM